MSYNSIYATSPNANANATATATALTSLNGSHQTHPKARNPQLALAPKNTPHCHLHNVHSPISYTPSSAGFVAMLEAYVDTGGTAKADDLAVFLQDRPHGGYVSLARLIGTRKVLGFKWRNTYWVPMFQFDLADLSIRIQPQQVMAEFNTEFDEWSMAVWFTQANAWLNGCKPVDLLSTELKSVIEAARADRFVAAG